MTPAQAEALRFVAYFIAENGYGPSYAEIAAGLGLASNGGVRRLVTGLVERGRMRRLPGRARAIEPVGRVAVSRAPDGAPLYFVPAPPPASGPRP